jgi:hypothetical protein
MRAKSNNTKQPKTQPENGPDFTVYFVPDRGNARWIPVGAAWQHRDGQGINLALDLMPTSPGRVVLRKPNRAGGEQ